MVRLSRKYTDGVSFDGMSLVLYIVACLAIPAAWGAITAWLFRRADSKASRGPDVDYII